MKNKALLFSTTLMGLISAPFHSQSMADHEGTLTITPSSISGYMSGDVRSKGFSFQPMLEYSNGSPSLEPFANLPISGKPDSEINFSASNYFGYVAKPITIKPSVYLYKRHSTDEDDGPY